MNKKMFVLFIMLFLPGPILAAPHVFNLKPEPAVRHVGTPLQERYAHRRGAGKMSAPASYPTATVNIYFLRVEFQKDDNPSASHTTGSGLWNDPLYAQDTPANPDDPDDPAFNYWVDRAKTRFVEYWKEVSYGFLPIEITVSPKIYQLPHSMSFYGDESDAALQSLIYDSVATTTTDTNIDFSLYDAVLIVHAGPGEESDLYGDSSGDIWSLYYADASFAPDAKPDAACSNCLKVSLRDGKPLTEAIIMPQTDSQDGFTVDPLGVYVHEFGHWLGLPDLYCVGVSCLSGGPDGVGKWSLMADGIYNVNQVDEFTPTWYGSTPAHMDAWSKVRLGWVTPATITSNADRGVKTLNPAETSQEIIKIQASTTAPSQYFLIENRQQTGFDEGLPGHGLLVWLIDDEVIVKNYPSNTINNDKNRPGVKLIEADNDWHLLSYGCDPPDDCGSAGDPFPGSMKTGHLTPHSEPSTAPYTMHAWVAIHDIVESGPTGTGTTVSANIGFTPFPPQLPGMYMNVVSWTPNTEPDIAGYNVYRNGVSIGRSEGPVFIDESARNFDSYRVTAVNTAGDESDPSGQVVANMRIEQQSDKRCFIATAAYGSYLDPHVEALRRFRDQHLLDHSFGRMLVSFYYRHSPSAAGFISRHESIRSMTRLFLTPVVFAVEHPSAFSLLVVTFGMTGFAAAMRSRKRRN